MKPEEYFFKPQTIAQKQYEALRMFFVERALAKDVAKKFKYTYRGFTTIVSEFRKKLGNEDITELFFHEQKKGRKRPEYISDAKELIIHLRKQYRSVEDIKVILDGKGYQVSERTIYNIITEEGFNRLPRRLKAEKQNLKKPKITAPKSFQIDFAPEEFKSSSGGILCLLPYIEKYGIRKIIEKSYYPQTKSISKLSSILAFIALKASNARRYTADDLWCMDRGQGLFAMLNALPKAAWYTSYSDRVTSEMNLQFLKSLHELWLSNELLGDTMNLDFTTIPYWGNDIHLENNYSGKRGKALASMLAVLAHDPDSGIIDYGDTNVMHKNESSVILEYLDFYQSTQQGRKELRYMIFDSKFTNYQNLNKLNNEGIKFITIRRRGKSMVEHIDKNPKSNWKTFRVDAAGNKKRSLKAFEEIVKLKDYDGNVRQINITGNGRIKPAIIITNDFDLTIENIVRKYTRRWIIEKVNSEQIKFFHLNNVSSSMVIKVDFDLTISILTHNLFRLFANDLERFSNIEDMSIYEKFLKNGADIVIENETINVKLKKKRNLPLILETMEKFTNCKYPFMKNMNLKFSGASYS
jgi:hypothetical protein